MLKTKWLMLTLSGTLLFTTSAQSSIMPFQPTTRQLIENKVDKNGMVQDLRLTKFMELCEKQKLENEKKAKEEKIKNELEEQKKIEPQWQEFELTFYSSLNCENGFGNITSTGSKLFDGVVASNHYKINTKIKLQGWGEVVVLDRGSDKYFNNDYRLDVYIPREHGESDNTYFKRVNKMGRIRVKGCIINE